MLAAIRKFLFYFVATLLVIVALGVGAMRLAMPQLPEYRDEIQARLAEALNGDVSFGRIDARWRWRGPEILLDDVVIGPSLGDNSIEPVRIESIAVGVSFSALALRRTAIIRHIAAEGVTVTLERNQQGWVVQDLPLVGNSDTQGSTTATKVDLDELPIDDEIDIRINDVNVVYTDRLTGRSAIVIDLVRSRVQLDEDTVTVDAALRRRGVTESRIDLFATGGFDARTLEGLLNGAWRGHADVTAMSADLARAFLAPSWRLPLGGSANLAADVNWDNGRLLAASVVLDADSLQPPDGGEQSQVSGRAELTRTDTGWLCAVDDFIVGVADRSWPAASMRLGFEETDATSRVRFDVANMTVYDLPYLASFLPEAAANTVLESRLSGTIVQGDGFLQFDRSSDGVSRAPGALQDFEVNLDYSGLSVAPFYGLPGFSNLTGTLRMTDETGSLTLDATDAQLSLPALFADSVAVDQVTGTLIWRRTDGMVSVVSDAIRFRSRSFEATGTVALDIAQESGVQSVDVDANWMLGDINDAKALLPVAVMSPKLARWLTGALRAGRITDGQFRFAGALSDFPFADGEGEFRASAMAEGVSMRYASQWPALTNVRAQVLLDGLSLSTKRNSGRSGNVPFRNAVVRFDDLTSGVLKIDTNGTAPLETLRQYSAQSPIARLLGGQVERMAMAGDAAYKVSLNIPLKAIRDFDLSAELATSNGDLSIDYLPFGVSAINGLVRIDRKGVYASDVEAEIFGAPALMSMAPAADQSGLVLDASGILPADALVEVFELPVDGKVSGATPFQARLKLPRAGQPSQQSADRTPVTVSVASDLAGLALDLPYPVGKQADEQAPVTMTLDIGESLYARLQYAPLIDVLAEFTRPEGGALAFDRATLHLGEGEALRSSVSGLFVDGAIDRLRLGDWLALRVPGETGVLQFLQSVAVEIGDLYVFGQRVRDVSGTLQRAGENWLIDVQGPSVSGTVALPAELGGSEPVVLDMRRLALLEADSQASGSVDPGALPAVRIRAESFALGEREFGVLEAELNRIEGGLQATRIATASDTFSVTATGSWLRDTSIAEGSLTRLQGEVRSTDVQRMMEQLGYAPGIGADALEADFEVSWEGGPGQDFLETLDGEARLKISDGTLEEVDPGAGRVIGLLSLVELPRRLSLDFSDVFRKGFTFEEIAGDFRMVNGDAYTCNLALQSPSADVGLIGRVSLAKRNYNQTAVVSVKVGNTLPAVGAVVAGPQVGAALLLFSQIFKKPLQGMTEVYYQINGSWDEPSIDRTDVERFVATSDLAGCLLDVSN